jgi:hypothetical protein
MLRLYCTCTLVHFPSQIPIQLSNKMLKRCKCEDLIILVSNWKALSFCFPQLVTSRHYNHHNYYCSITPGLVVYLTGIRILRQVRVRWNISMWKAKQALLIYTREDRTKWCFRRLNIPHLSQRTPFNLTTWLFDTHLHIGNVLDPISVWAAGHALSSI